MLCLWYFIVIKSTAANNVHMDGGINLTPHKV